MLIRAGADLRSVDEELSTPLHEAAAVDNDKTVKLILNACKKEIATYTEVCCIVCCFCFCFGFFLCFFHKI